MDFKNSIKPQDFDPEVFESFAEAILDDVDAYLRDEYCRLVDAERLMLNPIFHYGSEEVLDCTPWRGSGL